MERGILAVISGFSGAGKGTAMRELCGTREEPKDPYRLSVSATTRSPRPGEQDGVDYFYKTREEFETMIREDALVEWAEYVGNYYGTPRSFVEEQLSKGKNVVLEIEVKGALQVKKKYPDAALIFLTTKDAKTLEDRLRGRQTETEEVIKSRLKRAAEEASFMEQYDYIVVNDELLDCVENLRQIISSEACRKENRTALTEQMQRELKERYLD